LMAYVNEGILP